MKMFEMVFGLIVCVDVGLRGYMGDDTRQVHSKNLFLIFQKQAVFCVYTIFLLLFLHKRNKELIIQ